MRDYLRENIIKNILVLVVAAAFYPTISSSAKGLAANEIGNFLTLISILLVTVCFANFAFTYEKCNLKKFSQRMLAHAATFIFMLLLALLLTALVLAIYTSFSTIFSISIIFSVLLYLGIALYDFWDLFRVE